MLIEATLCFLGCAAGRFSSFIIWVTHPFLSSRNHLHLQGAQLQQALLDIRGSVEFAERLLSCGSDTEILSTKGVTLRRLTSLAESSYEPQLAAFAPDDSSSICFLPTEPAGEVEGYPLVGVINSRTLDVSRCTAEGEGKRLTEK